MRLCSTKTILAISATAACLAGVCVWLVSSGDTPSQSPIQSAPAAGSVKNRANLAVSPVTQPSQVHASQPIEPEPLADLPYTSLSEFSVALGKATTDKADARTLAHLLNTSRAKLSALDHATLLSQANKQLADTDLAKAASVLRQLKNLSDQQIMASGVTTLAVAKDPQAAAAFASSLAGHDMARTAHQVVGREWAQLDRVAVTDWINKTSDSNLQGAIAEGMAQTWASTDMEGLTQWAATIPDLYVQTAVLVKAVKVLAATDPEQSAAWALKFPAGMARRQALVYASSRWGASDPQAAGTWALQLSDPAAQLEAATGVVNGWMPVNRPAAQAWAAQLPANIRQQVIAATQLAK